MWEIHMLGLTRRELETDPRGTAPVLDPTDEGGLVKSAKVRLLRHRQTKSIKNLSFFFQG